MTSLLIAKRIPIMPREFLIWSAVVWSLVVIIYFASVWLTKREGK
jgi:hypothetical protein